MHLPFGGENRNLGWNLLPGGFVLPSGLGPEKVSSAVLVFFNFFSLKWKIPPVSGVDFIAVFVPVAKTLVSSPSAGPRTAITVFPWQLVAASGFRIKSKTRPFCPGGPSEGRISACGRPSWTGQQVCISGLVLWEQRGNFGFAVPGVQLRGARPLAGTMAGSREPRAAPCCWPGTASSWSRGCLCSRSSLAISIALSGGEEGCYQPSSFLPQRDVGWVVRGGEKIFLAGGCAIGTISAIRSTVPLRPGQGGDASWPEMSPRSPLLFVVLAVEMHRVPCPRWQPVGSGASSSARQGLGDPLEEMLLQRGF